VLLDEKINNNMKKKITESRLIHTQNMPIKPPPPPKQKKRIKAHANQSFTHSFSLFQIIFITLLVGGYKK
jgi:hypothetical protein